MYTLRKKSNLRFKTENLFSHKGFFPFHFAHYPIKVALVDGETTERVRSTYLSMLKVG